LNFVRVALSGITPEIDALVHSAPVLVGLADVGLADADVGLADADVGSAVGLADAAVSDELEQLVITSVAAPAIDKIATALLDFFETRTSPPG